MRARPRTAAASICRYDSLEPRLRRRRRMLAITGGAAALALLGLLLRMFMRR
jgi:hypothetical protein